MIGYTLIFVTPQLSTIANATLSLRAVFCSSDWTGLLRLIDICILSEITASGSAERVERGRNARRLP